MPRLLSTLLVLGLLGGTAAAFAVTERLKLVPSPIVAPKLTKAFSPVCDCPTDEARIRFGLRHADRLTVTVIDADDRPVRTIADGEQFPAGPVEFVWDGRGAPEGAYRVRVHLADARRTIDIPNEMRLDTTQPVLDVLSVAPRVFSPDGDRNGDFVRVRFRLSERSRVVLSVGGKEVVRSTPRRAGDGKIEWYGRGAREGPHSLVIVAYDLAGNRSREAQALVRLRFIELVRRQIVVPPGVRFGVGVSTDAERYRWRLGARTGSSGSRTLRLLSPARPGRYTLTVSYDGHRDAIPVFVRAQP
ncbi:MAG: FlgD immunoglobulin-like domain containing protein [Actinomycetota bacterium]